MGQRQKAGWAFVIVGTFGVRALRDAGTAGWLSGLVMALMALVILALILDLLVSRPPVRRILSKGFARLGRMGQSAYVEPALRTMQWSLFGLGATVTCALVITVCSTTLSTALHATPAWVLWGALCLLPLASCIAGYFIMATRMINGASRRFSDALLKIAEAKSILFSSRPHDADELERAIAGYTARVRGAILTAHGLEEDRGLVTWLSGAIPSEECFHYIWIDAHNDLKTTARSISLGARQPFFSALVRDSSNSSEPELFFGSLASVGLLGSVFPEAMKELDSPLGSGVAPFSYSSQCKALYLDYGIQIENKDHAKYFHVGSHCRAVGQVDGGSHGASPVAERAVFMLLATHSSKAWLSAQDQLLLNIAGRDLEAFISREVHLVDRKYFFSPGLLRAICSALWKRKEVLAGIRLGAEMDSDRFGPGTTRKQANLAGLDELDDTLSQVSVARPDYFDLELIAGPSKKRRVLLVQREELILTAGDPANAAECPQGRLARHELGKIAQEAADLVALETVVREALSGTPPSDSRVFVACWPESLSSRAFKDSVIALNSSLPRGIKLGIAVRLHLAPGQVSSDWKGGASELAQSGIELGGFVNASEQIDALTEFGGHVAVISTGSSLCENPGGSESIREKSMSLAYHSARKKVDPVLIASNQKEKAVILRPHTGLPKSTHFVSL